MDNTPKVDVQAVVEALMERIGALELEVAVLKTLLNAREDASQPEAEQPSGDEPGLYL